MPTTRLGSTSAQLTLDGWPPPSLWHHPHLQDPPQKLQALQVLLAPHSDILNINGKKRRNGLGEEGKNWNGGDWRIGKFVRTSQQSSPGAPLSIPFHKEKERRIHGVQG